MLGPGLWARDTTRRSHSRVLRRTGKEVAWRTVWRYSSPGPSQSHLGRSKIGIRHYKRACLRANLWPAEWNAVSLRRPYFTIHILKNNHSKPRLFIQAWPIPVPTPTPTPDICRAFVKCFLPTVGHLLGSARGWGISQTWYLKTSSFIQKLTNWREAILKRRAPYCKGLWRAFAKEFVLVC